MTEPDEATLWARRYWADRSERQGFSEIAEAYRSGKSDKSLRQEARAYRAGQAASAERIKALEEALRKQIALHNSPIINQHLIDAARLEGIRLGLEAAARGANEWQMQIRPCDRFVDDAIRRLDPAAIANGASREP